MVKYIKKHIMPFKDIFKDEKDVIRKKRYWSFGI